MGLLDKFFQKLMRETLDRRHHAAPTSLAPPTFGHRSHTGTKAQRRKRRKIAHESRRVNFQKGA